MAIVSFHVLHVDVFKEQCSVVSYTITANQHFCPPFHFNLTRQSSVLVLVEHGFWLFLKKACVMTITCHRNLGRIWEYSWPYYIILWTSLTSTKLANPLLSEHYIFLENERFYFNDLSTPYGSAVSQSVKKWELLLWVSDVE